MRLRSLRSKCFSPGKGSWYDPEQLGLKVILALLYMAGLVSFQRYTGLLNIQPSSISSTKIHSSEEALHWLRNYDINSGHSRLIRSLMALPEDMANNGTDFMSSNSSTNSTNGTMMEAEVIADPLFPPDLFTMEQIKNGYNCSVCPSSFSSMPLLYKHFTANHDQENLPFKCGQCTRRFRDKKERLDHVLQMHSIFHR